MVVACEKLSRSNQIGIPQLVLAYCNKTVFLFCAWMITLSCVSTADAQESKPTSTPSATPEKKDKGYGTYCQVSSQFRDNVTLSSDIDHTGLRIGATGKIRIFVTNTTTVDLQSLELMVTTDAFDVDVKPWSHWEEFPDLKTMQKGGKPQAFDVTFTRKPNIPDGEYEVSFRLLNLCNSSFPTSAKRRGVVTSTSLNLLARNPIEIKNAKVTMDGRMDAAVWEASPAYTALCDYVQMSTVRPWIAQYAPLYGYEVSKIQSRFRLAHDDANLYVYVDFLNPTKFADQAFIYVAPSLDAEPVELRLDRLKKTCLTKAGDAGIRVAADDLGRVFEIEVPRKLLGIDKTDSFYANFARTVELSKGKGEEPASRHVSVPFGVSCTSCHSTEPKKLDHHKSFFRPDLILAADANNVYCKLNFDEVAKGTVPNLKEIEFYLVPDGPPQGNPIPRRFLLNPANKTVTCNDEKIDVTLLKYEVAEDGKNATLTIPRSLVYLESKDKFFVHACFVSENNQVVWNGPVRSFWRGNRFSVSDPHVYEKFVMVN